MRLVGSRGEDGRLSGCGKGYVALEASRLARLILQIRGSARWGIDDGAGGRRAPRFGDMAVLLPALTHVVALEEELRGYNIPYVLEGGKFYYARAEVSSALTVLRAVANPNDQVAVYGALRSIFFGLSDEELLRARVAGIPFDYRASRPRAPLFGALTSCCGTCTAAGSGALRRRRSNACCTAPEPERCSRRAVSSPLPT